MRPAPPVGTRRRAPALLPVLLLLLLMAAACQTTEQPDVGDPAPEQTGPRPDSEQWQAVIELHDRGLKRSVIEAEYLAVYQLPGNNRTRLDTLAVDFFDEEGAPSSNLIADSGEIFDQDREGRRRVKTWGGVVLTGTEGQVVRADTLWWDEADDRLYTDGPVEVTREGEILQAVGFESDTRLEEMRLGTVTGSSVRGGEWMEEERSRDRGAAPDTASVPPDTTSIPPYRSASKSRAGAEPGQERQVAP